MSVSAGFIQFGGSAIDLLTVFAFFGFAIAGPILVVVALVLTLRRRSRHVGLVMLLSGVGGFFCVATAAAWQAATRTPVALQIHWPESSGVLLTFGMAGFTASVIAAMLLRYRSRRGLTKR